MKQVLVGVDGSAPATDAVDWAAAEALRRGAELRMVTVHPAPLAEYPAELVSSSVLSDGMRADARRVLTGAVERARTQSPGVPVTAEVRRGDPVAELVHAAQTADLVVVGTRGRGGLAGLLLGSTAAGVAAHSARPTVVVRGESRVDGPVVAAVSGGPADAAVIEFAAAQARRCGDDLLVVRAVDDWLLELADHLSRGALDLDLLVKHTAEDLDAALAPVRDSGLPVRCVVERARAADVLLARSRAARLLVLGARTRPLGGSIGSVAHALLRHTDCPVAVVHPR